jgi:hypothetical protein
VKWVKIVVGAVIAISVIPVLVEAVTGLTGAEGALTGTPAGALLALTPLVLVAGILTFIFAKSGSSAN